MSGWPSCSRSGVNGFEDAPAFHALFDDVGSWSGACFVFDDRVSVGHGLEVAGTSLCHGCRRPLAAAALLSPDYEAGVSCPQCVVELTLEKKASARERQRQIGLARGRGERHLGPRRVG